MYKGRGIRSGRFLSWFLTRWKRPFALIWRNVLLTGIRILCLHRRVTTISASEWRLEASPVLPSDWWEMGDLTLHDWPLTAFDTRRWQLRSIAVNDSIWCKHLLVMRTRQRRWIMFTTKMHWRINAQRLWAKCSLTNFRKSVVFCALKLWKSVVFYSSKLRKSVLFGYLKRWKSVFFTP